MYSEAQHGTAASDRGGLTASDAMCACFHRDMASISKQPAWFKLGDESEKQYHMQPQKVLWTQDR